MPGKKIARRIYVNGEAVVDLLQRPEETPPKVGEYFVCRHPVEHHTQEQVKPCRIEDVGHRSKQERNMLFFCYPRSH